MIAEDVPLADAPVPPGAAEGAIGTDPISFAFPTGGEPFVVDMGTSAFMGTDLKFRARRKDIGP